MSSFSIKTVGMMMNHTRYVKLFFRENEPRLAAEVLPFPPGGSCSPSKSLENKEPNAENAEDAEVEKPFLLSICGVSLRALRSWRFILFEALIPVLPC